MNKQQRQEEQQAIEHARVQLHKWLKPGDTVYTVLRHVSASGMTRRISCFVAAGTDKPEIVDITWYVAKIQGRKRHRDGGLVVGGCGMDMGYHVVYNLARALWKDGFNCTGERCPGNDHFNGVDAKLHKDGGYALHHQWL